MPERDIYAGIQQDVDEIAWLDELGYSEAWVGEHLTAPWEPYPAGDLIIAQALARTKRIKVNSGGYIPSFYNPAALALRVAQLDHMAQGRYICGIAIGGQPPDWALLNIDGAAGENRDMAIEAVEIMQKMWTQHVDGGEWTYKGKHWTVGNGVEFGGLRAHMQPFQKGGPDIAVAGMSPGSSSLKWAGSIGAHPLSVLFNSTVLRSHWEVYSEASTAAGHVPDRKNWRIQREMFVADTDDEAKEYVRNSTQARLWNEYYFPLFHRFGWLDFIKHDPSVADDKVDIEYLMDHLWLVGSPSTVADKLAEVNDEVGGFGTALCTKYDWGTVEDPRAHETVYRRHLSLLAEEVMPQVNSLISVAQPA